MAAEVSSSDSSDDLGVLSAINVTPFVDVVLVLLVIFIATAPIILKETLQVRLPKAAATDGAQATLDTLGVAVSSQGEIFLNGNLVSGDELKLGVQKKIAENPNTQALISADENARHADVVRAIGLIKSAGLERFALQVKRDDQN